ncbi:hypothetical protein [Nocardia tengchongensis]|uniref:hypothetical protein n=1 Tax=Nocardia tengchongensis TaxID=2055889 RepID=UPI00360AE6C0
MSDEIDEHGKRRYTVDQIAAEFGVTRFHAGEEFPTRMVKVVDMMIVRQQVFPTVGRFNGVECLGAQ